MEMNWLSSLVLIIFGYLLGSIPTSYLVARWVKHIDLRNYGSGTVSGSMFYEHVSRWMVVPVALFDIFKGAFPTWLGLQLGLGDIVAVTAGMAAVAGHNWPLYLGFTGGRGLGTFSGLLLVIFPWGFVLLGAFLVLGFLLGDSAPWALAAIVLMPLLVFFMDGSGAAYWAIGMMLVLTVAKRLEANRRPLPIMGADRRKVLFLRMFFDRDIGSHKEWIRRTPESDLSQSS
jgi:glycerol-3-phosphate acyltransferase PlsY